MNYSKWDNIEDSDDDEPKAGPLVLPPPENEELEHRRNLQEQLDEWLRRQMYQLKKEEDKNTGPKHIRNPELYALHEDSKKLAPYRKVTKEERKTLAMLIAVSDFAEGQTNLTRHPQLLDLVRHNRWMEEDPGTLELLCRIHNMVMRSSGDKSAKKETPYDAEMRNKLLCGINTLAAPKRSKCPGGLLELATLICTPETDSARELRRKWQNKDFAKDAVLDSLFPDLKGMGDGDGSSDSMWEVWALVAILVIIVVGVIFFAVYGVPGNFGGTGRKSAKAAKEAAKAAKVAADAAMAKGAAEISAVVPEVVAKVAAAAADVAAGGAEAPGAYEL